MKTKVEVCIKRINEKLNEIRLELGVGKTEILRYIQKPLWQRAEAGLETLYHFNVNGTVILPKTCIKYLTSCCSGNT